MTHISQESSLQTTFEDEDIYAKHFCSMLPDQNTAIYAYPNCFFFSFSKGGWCVFLASEKIDLIGFKVSSDIKGIKQQKYLK